MVHGVEDLLRRQTHVDGVHHRADHRDGKHAFQVSVAVPIHHRHGVTGLDPGFGQHVGQAGDTLIELWIGQPQLVAVDDLAGLFIAAAGHQQAFDQQRKAVGALGGLDDAGLQHGYPFLKSEPDKSVPTVVRQCDGQISRRNDLAARGMSGIVRSMDQPLPCHWSRTYAQPASRCVSRS
ncbi:hypothetical protein D3C73_1070690 [compost metagenome]